MEQPALGQGEINNLIVSYPLLAESTSVFHKKK